MRGVEKLPNNAIAKSVTKVYFIDRLFTFFAIYRNYMCMYVCIYNYSQFFIFISCGYIMDPDQWMGINIIVCVYTNTVKYYKYHECNRMHAFDQIDISMLIVCVQLGDLKVFAEIPKTRTDAEKKETASNDNNNSQQQQTTSATTTK